MMTEQTLVCVWNLQLIIFSLLFYRANQAVNDVIYCPSCVVTLLPFQMKYNLALSFADQKAKRNDHFKPRHNSMPETSTIILNHGMM
jgi:hypothetical protein